MKTSRQNSLKQYENALEVISQMLCAWAQVSALSCA